VLLSACVLLIIIVALIAIPYDVMSLLFENGIGHRARRRSQQNLDGTSAVGNFYGGFLLGALIPAGIIIAVVFAIDTGMAYSSAGPPDRIEADVPVNNEKPQIDRAPAQQEMPTTPSVDWKVWLLAVVIGIACVVLVVLPASRGYGVALANAVVGSSDKDRRKTATHYLRNTAQQKARL
jgi:hypothetical protein